MPKTYLAYLIVREIATQKEVGRIGVTQIGERRTNQIIRGMLINMRDDCYVDDSEVDAARNRQEQTNA